MTATQAPAPALAGPKNTPMRRRWGRVAVGAVLALIGGLVSAQLYLTAGDRVEVVVLADDVDRFAEIEADDLTTARVAADPTVDMVSASSRDNVIGRVAAFDLAAGSLLVPDQLHPEDDPLVPGDQSVVPIELPASQVPSGLTPGTELRVVLEGGGTSGEDVREVPGWLLEMGERRDDHTRAQALEVVVSRSSAADVAVAAGNGRVYLTVDGVDGTG